MAAEKDMRLREMPREKLIAELRHCWAHFRRCLAALNGDPDVKPAILFGSPELGDSDDLELFYACKRKGGTDGEQ